MTWTATENFDSYTAPEDLAGKDGGTGWGGAWTNIGAGPDLWTVQVAPSGGQGGNSAASVNPTTNEVRYERPISSAQTAGKVTWRMRTSATPDADESMLRLGDGPATPKLAIQMAANGNIQILNNTTWDTIQAFSIDTWYTMEIEFDNPGQPNTYRARIDAGSWTDWKTVMGATYTSISHLQINSPVTGGVRTFYIDDIKPPPSEGFLVILNQL